MQFACHKFAHAKRRSKGRYLSSETSTLLEPGHGFLTAIDLQIEKKQQRFKGNTFSTKKSSINIDLQKIGNKSKHIGRWWLISVDLDVRLYLLRILWQCSNMWLLIFFMLLL